MTHLLWVPIMIVFEISKRIITPIFFPLAYKLRKKMRGSMDQASKGNLYKFKGPWFLRPLWWMLDDSINIEGFIIYGSDVEYCMAPDKRSSLVERLPDGRLKEFARAFYWSSLRNNCINLSRVMAPGYMASQAMIFGALPKNFCCVRTYSSGKKRPYIQWYLWGNIRFKAGFLTNGRWELQLRERL